jgi:hypothetical protein
MLHGNLRAIARLAPWLTPVMAFRNSFQPGWFTVKGLERVGAPLFNLVLRKSSSERRSEVVPNRIEPMVGHLKNTADVGSPYRKCPGVKQFRSTRRLSAGALD